jgi:hypothetical protein
MGGFPAGVSRAMIRASAKGAGRKDIMKITDTQAAALAVIMFVGGPIGVGWAFVQAFYG